MSKDWKRASSEEKATLYFQAGGSFSLSRPALVGLCQDILNKGLPFRFCAPGPSMSPFIRDGDIITLVPYLPASCRSGDVVAFVQRGTDRLIVHRVVGVSSDGCRIRGDNTLEEDGEIAHSYILGRAVLIERAGKKVRLGLGPERKMIALLSLWKLLPYCISAAGSVCSVIRRLK